MTEENFPPIPRVLAIDPTTVGFAYALLEGPRLLHDWSVLHVRSPKHTNALARLTLLIVRLRPHLIAVEDLPERSRRGEGARNLIRGVEMLALTRRVKVRRVSRREVEASLGLEAGTKYDIARAIAERFPVLVPRLPRKRKPWMAEDERMSVFDAVGLAYAAVLRGGEAGRGE